MRTVGEGATKDPETEDWDGQTATGGDVEIRRDLENEGDADRDVCEGIECSTSSTSACKRD